MVPGVTSPVIGVLAVQGDVREHLAALEAVGARAVRVRRPQELAAVAGLVVPGGESTTIDKLVRAFELREPLLQRLAEGMPAFGSCAGMILLADRVEGAGPGQLTLGGIDMTVRRNAFGRQVDSFEDDLEFTGVAGPAVRAVFIRAPWVEAVGERVEVLARSRRGPAGPDAGPEPVPAAPSGRSSESTSGAGSASTSGPRPDAVGRIVAVRQGNLLATSFHPEITGDTRVHRYFVDLVRGAV